MNKKSRDSIYAQPLQSVPGFSFDQSVVSVFDDMIQRSVPGYSTVVAMSGVLAERYAVSNSNLYDLGCSLGATSLAMAEKLAVSGQDNCRIIAIDNSQAMLDKFNLQLSNRELETRKTETPKLKTPKIETRLNDIQNVDIADASIVALNYTLQFIPREDRKDLLQKIYEGMLPGAVLILSEKVLFDDVEVNNTYIDLHHEFKRANGYSDLEISQKRQALEDVLRAETLNQHRERLQSCGFQRVEVWFQCLNFASLMAFK